MKTKTFIMILICFIVLVVFGLISYFSRQKELITIENNNQNEIQEEVEVDKVLKDIGLVLTIPNKWLVETESANSNYLTRSYTNIKVNESVFVISNLRFSESEIKDMENIKKSVSEGHPPSDYTGYMPEEKYWYEQGKTSVFIGKIDGWNLYRSELDADTVIIEGRRDGDKLVTSQLGIFGHEASRNWMSVHYEIPEELTDAEKSNQISEFDKVLLSMKTSE